MGLSSIGSGAGVLNAGVWSLWGTPDPNPTNARAMWDSEGALFENATYRIRIGADQTVMVANQRSGETYMAFAPQVGDDGASCLDACDSVTLVLDDGTKLTLQTTFTAVESDGGPAASQRTVTITCNDFGLQVSGLGSSAGLACVQSLAYGWLLDGAVADGHTLHENAQGAGLWGADPHGAWQGMGKDSINAEELAALAELSPWLSECMKALVSLHCLLSITLVGNHRTLLGKGADERHALGREGAKRPERAPADEGAAWSSGCGAWPAVSASRCTGRSALKRTCRRTLGRTLARAATSWHMPRGLPRLQATAGQRSDYFFGRQHQSVFDGAARARLRQAERWQRADAARSRLAVCQRRGASREPECASAQPG
jgi:hypothetical protein